MGEGREGREGGGEGKEELLGRGQRNAILASRTRVGGEEGRGGEGGVAGKRTEERYPGQSHPGRWEREGRGGKGEGKEELLGRGQMNALLASRTRVSGGREGRGGEGGVVGKRAEERYPGQSHPGRWGGRGGGEGKEELLGRGQRNAILASRTRVSGGREGRGGEGGVVGKRAEERYPGQSHPGRWGGGGEGRGGEGGVAGKRAEERYPGQSHPGRWGKGEGRGGEEKEGLLGRGQRNAILASRTRVGGGRGSGRGGEGKEELLGRGQKNAILASRTRVSGGRGRGGQLPQGGE